jgi:hypothetical protein
VRTVTVELDKGWTLTKLSASYWPVGGGKLAPLNNITYNAQGQFPITGGNWQAMQIAMPAQNTAYYFVVDVSVVDGAMKLYKIRFGPFKATSSK